MENKKQRVVLVSDKKEETKAEPKSARAFVRDGFFYRDDEVYFENGVPQF